MKLNKELGMDKNQSLKSGTRSPEMMLKTLISEFLDGEIFTYSIARDRNSSASVLTDIVNGTNFVKDVTRHSILINGESVAETFLTEAPGYFGGTELNVTIDKLRVLAAQKGVEDFSQTLAKFIAQNCHQGGLRGFTCEFDFVRDLKNKISLNSEKARLYETFYYTFGCFSKLNVEIKKTQKSDQIVHPVSEFILPIPIMKGDKCKFDDFNENDLKDLSEKVKKIYKIREDEVVKFHEEQEKLSDTEKRNYDGWNYYGSGLYSKIANKIEAALATECLLNKYFNIYKVKFEYDVTEISDNKVELSNARGFMSKISPRISLWQRFLAILRKLKEVILKKLKSNYNPPNIWEEVDQSGKIITKTKEVTLFDPLIVKDGKQEEQELEVEELGINRDNNLKPEHDELSLNYSECQLYYNSSQSDLDSGIYSKSNISMNSTSSPEVNTSLQRIMPEGVSEKRQDDTALLR